MKRYANDLVMPPPGFKYIRTTGEHPLVVPGFSVALGRQVFLENISNFYCVLILEILL
jgi:hypothetical protein